MNKLPNKGNQVPLMPPAMEFPEDMGNAPPATTDELQRNEMLKQLTALDFMAVDLHLYLDTHPLDKAALAKYNCIIVQADALRDLFQSKYGPLYSYRSPSLAPWQWTRGPWPWQKAFNFELVREERSYVDL